MKVRRVRRRGGIEWVVDYRLNNRRTRRHFATRAKAEAELTSVRQQQRDAGSAWLALPAPQRTECMMVADEVFRAGLSLRAVWEDWRVNRAAGPVECRTLRQAIAEVMASKTAAKRRPAYLNSLRLYLAQFAKGREELTVDQVTTAQVEQWFANRHEAASSRVANVGRLSALFSLCVRRGYMRENPCKRLEPVSIEQRPPQILAPRQIARLLLGFLKRHPKDLAAVVLSVMAGLRPHEAKRLTWDAIDLERGLVNVDAAASKVRQRRLVHLMPAAVEWLRVAKAEGSALPMTRSAADVLPRKARAVLRLKRWPQDVLRHTAASYLLAHHRNAALVALELGNSPYILLRHYHEMVTPENAARTWAFQPKARHLKAA